MVRHADVRDRDHRSVAETPLPATEARQGRLGRPVLIVLLAGLVIAMLAWIPAEWWGSSVAPPEDRAVEQAYPENTVQPTEPNSGN